MSPSPSSSFLFSLFVPLAKTINKRYLLVHNNNVVQKQIWLTRNRHICESEKKRKCVNLRSDMCYMYWQKMLVIATPTISDRADWLRWNGRILMLVDDCFLENVFYCLFFFFSSSSFMFPFDRRNKFIQESNLVFSRYTKL
jgi:hypothetical protein